jgi:PST family polysaccharide transporter/lipopolysaccharide exporter
VFSQVQNDMPALRSVHGTALRWSSVLAFPTAVGLWLTAPELIAFIFGPGWEPTTPLLRWLAPVVAIQPLLQINGALTLSRGRANLRLLEAVAMAAIALPLYWWWLPRGAEGMAAAFTVATLLTLPLDLMIACRMLEQPLFSTLRPLVPNASGAILMGLVVASTGFHLPPSLPNSIVLAIKVVAGCLVYCGWILWVSRDLLHLGRWRDVNPEPPPRKE